MVTEQNLHGLARHHRYNSIRDKHVLPTTVIPILRLLLLFLILYESHIHPTLQPCNHIPDFAILPASFNNVPAQSPNP